MSTISVQDIQRDPAAFFQRVKAGEAFVIVQEGRALAEIHPTPAAPKQLRPYGLCAGQIKVSPDFDDPLPDEILKEFEGR